MAQALWCGKHHFKIVRSTQKCVWLTCVKCSAGVSFRRAGIRSALVTKPKYAYRTLQRNQIK